MNLTVGKLSKLSGVSVRTLHYYDEIGLLKPEQKTSSGYRLYGGNACETLMQIMFLKELDMPLEEISSILNSPKFNKIDAVKRHSILLTAKRKHLDGLILLCEKIIKGENEMSFNEFDNSEFEKQKALYAKEAKQLWGETQAYKESELKASQRTPQMQKELEKKQEMIFASFAKAIPLGAESERAQELALLWHEHISKNYYACSKQLLLDLGEMYVGDERFKQNLDKYGDGTAQFIHDAIKHYCKN